MTSPKLTHQIPHFFFAKLFHLQHALRVRVVTYTPVYVLYRSKQLMKILIHSVFFLFFLFLGGRFLVTYLPTYHANLEHRDVLPSIAIPGWQGPLQLCVGGEL